MISAVKEHQTSGSATGVKSKLKANHVNMVFTRGKSSVNVLSDISLDVAEGEFVCILGPSGCGKSTLLNIVGGFLTPTSGDVRSTASRSTVPTPPHLRVPGARRLPVADRRRQHRLRSVQTARGRARERIAHYVELVGLQGFEQAYPRELSGGMKQRVEVARALAVNPDMLFLDEPFGALDSITRLQMRARAAADLGRRRRKTILFVTHDIEESVQLADRVVVMSRAAGDDSEDRDDRHRRIRATSARGATSSCATASSRRSAWRTRYERRPGLHPAVGTAVLAARRRRGHRRGVGGASSGGAARRSSRRRSASQRGTRAS